MTKENVSKKGLFAGVVGLLVVSCVCSISILYIFFNNTKNISRVLLPSNYLNPTTLSPVSNIPSPHGTEDVTNYFNTAYSLTQQGNCIDAIQYWDLVIAEMPENGTAYYYRAKCYYQLTLSQNIKSEYERDNFQALDDVNQAIVYGVNVEQPGDPYYLRFQIFDSIEGQLESRATRDSIGQLELQNLRMATILGTSEKYAEQRIPLVSFSLGKCQDGMNEIKQLKEYYGVSAPPSSSILNIEAQGYFCLGELDKALEYANRGLSIESMPERVWLRSVILYLMGRNDEALNDLDGLIQNRPEYSGYRYYLRGLIYYEKGERELAEADLTIGSRNTWEQDGLRAYVLGQMALDDGNKEEGIYYLQRAWASLDWYFHPLLPKIEQQLNALGAQPLAEEPQLQNIVQSTPIPTAFPIPTSQIAVSTSTHGFAIPPNIRQIDIATGTGQMQVVGGIYPYPVYLFKTQKSVSIKSVQNLTLHLEPYLDQESDRFEVFLWELETGEWKMSKPGWGSVSIEDPDRFVDSNGDVYIALRWDADLPFMIKNIWLSIEATGVDGSPIILGLNK